MTSRPISNPPPVRLNPFAFPSSTDITFLLFLSILFGSSLFIFNALYYALPLYEEYTVQIYEQCSNFPGNIILSENIEGFVDNLRAFIRCVTPAAYARLEWIISGTALVFALAGLVYWLYPLWIMRRGRFVNLRDGALPEIRQYLSELSQEIGLARQPAFLANPLNRSNNGQTLGHFRDYSIILNGGLLMNYYRNRSVFRFVVLHEMAHIKNSDVDKTYFTIAAWWVFMFGALVPLLIALPITGEPPVVILHVVWRVLLLTLFLYTTGAAVLRTREVYADVRASVWEGSDEGVRTRFEPSNTAPTGGSWRGLFQFHPSDSERSRAIAEPHRVMKTGMWELFCAGVAAAVAYHNIYVPVLIPLISLLSFVPSSVLGPLWSFGLIGASQGLALIFAPLILGVAAAGLWQKKLLEATGSESPDQILPMSISLALGLLAGYKISLLSIGFSTDTSVLGPSIPEAELPVLKGISLFLFDLIWLFVLVAGLIFFMRWFADGVSIWLDVALVRKSPRAAYRFSLLMGSLLLSIWLGIFLYLYWIISGSGSDLMGAANVPVDVFGGQKIPEIFLPGLLIFGVLGLTVMNPTTILSIVLLWLFPMLAWLAGVPNRSERVSSWAALTPDSQLPAQAASRPLVQPVPAFAFGIAGGALFFVYMLANIFLLRYVLSVNETIAFFLISVCFLVTVAVQLVVGAITTIWVKRFGVWHAVFATFVSGCFIVAAYLTFILSSGADIPPPFAGIDPAYTWIIMAFVFASLIINLVQIFIIPLAILISLGKYLISQGRS